MTLYEAIAALRVEHGDKAVMAALADVRNDVWRQHATTINAKVYEAFDAMRGIPQQDHGWGLTSLLHERISTQKTRPEQVQRVFDLFAEAKRLAEEVGLPFCIDYMYDSVEGLRRKSNESFDSDVWQSSIATC